MEDRLAHCRVASWAGTADGLIVGVDADVQAGSIVTMHVEERQHRYWATWGFVARLGGQPAAAGWASERMPALAAA